MSRRVWQPSGGSAKSTERPEVTLCARLRVHAHTRTRIQTTHTRARALQCAALIVCQCLKIKGSSELPQACFFTVFSRHMYFYACMYTQADRHTHTLTPSTLALQYQTQRCQVVGKRRKCKGNARRRTREEKS